MFWAPMVNLLVILAVWCWGSDSQMTSIQPSSASVSPGNTAKLSCATGGSYGVHWYQKKPGSSPRYLLYFYSDSSKHQGSGIPSRFSGSRDASTNTGYLTISRAVVEDEATYYCAFWTGSAFVFGGGTHLTVTGQDPVHPSVFLFPPSQEEIKTKSKATLVCLMDEFHPGVIQVEWKADGTTISSGVETTKPLKQGNKYMASSYLTLSESDWKSHNKYSCKVTHESETIEKEVNRLECS